MWTYMRVGHVDFHESIDMCTCMRVGHVDLHESKTFGLT